MQEHEPGDVQLHPSHGVVPARSLGPLLPRPVAVGGPPPGVPHRVVDAEAAERGAVLTLSDGDADGVRHPAALDHVEAVGGHVQHEPQLGRGVGRRSDRDGGTAAFAAAGLRSQRDRTGRQRDRDPRGQTRSSRHRSLLAAPMRRVARVRAARCPGMVYGVRGCAGARVRGCAGARVRGRTPGPPDPRTPGPPDPRTTGPPDPRTPGPPDPRIPGSPTYRRPTNLTSSRTQSTALAAAAQRSQSAPESAVAPKARCSGGR
jgi:hypothetical protein